MTQDLRIFYKKFLILESLEKNDPNNQLHTKRKLLRNKIVHGWDHHKFKYGNILKKIPIQKQLNELVDEKGIDSINIDDDLVDIFKGLIETQMIFKKYEIESPMESNNEKKHWKKYQSKRNNNSNINNIKNEQTNQSTQPNRQSQSNQSNQQSQSNQSNQSNQTNQSRKFINKSENSQFEIKNNSSNDIKELINNTTNDLKNLKISSNDIKSLRLFDFSFNSTDNNPQSVLDSMLDRWSLFFGSKAYHFVSKFDSIHSIEFNNWLKKKNLDLNDLIDQVNLTFSMDLKKDKILNRLRNYLKYDLGMRIHNNSTSSTINTLSQILIFRIQEIIEKLMNNTNKSLWVTQFLEFFKIDPKNNNSEIIQSLNNLQSNANKEIENIIQIEINSMEFVIRNLFHQINNSIIKIRTNKNRINNNNNNSIQLINETQKLNLTLLKEKLIPWINAMKEWENRKDLKSKQVNYIYDLENLNQRSKVIEELIDQDIFQLPKSLNSKINESISLPTE